MTDDPDFIRRWSRRKRAARQNETIADDPPVDSPDAEPEGGETPAATKPEIDDDSSKPGSDEAPEDLDLPDIDSLSSDSDFKPFLKKGVPKELRNQAMRKLWRVNPAFGHLDGLNDYDGDFTDAATVVKGLKTLYKVGRGFLPESKPEPPAEEPQTEESPEVAATDAAGEPTEDLDRPEPDAVPDSEPDGNKVT